MKNVSLFILSLIALNSCLKLDDIAFNGEKIEAYLFDDYPTKYLNLNQSYAIADSNIYLFTLASKLPSESSSTTIYAAYIGNRNRITQDTIILYAHGQSAHMDAYWERTKLLANVGGKNQYGVLTLDYRGFGLSEGKSTEASLYEDVRTALRWLKNQGVNPNKVMLYGYSLGCIPSIEINAHFNEFKPAKLMIESPIGSVQNITEESVLINTSSTFFTGLSFDNAENIKSVTQPLLWLHGTNDTYVKIEQGELVYANYVGPYKEAHRVAGAGHGDVPTAMGLDNYSQIVLDFIRK